MATCSFTVKIVDIIPKFQRIQVVAKLPLSKRSVSNIIELVHTIVDKSIKNLTRCLPEDVKEGSLVLVKVVLFGGSEPTWVRAQILGNSEVLGDIQVLLSDFGTYYPVSTANLFKVPDSLPSLQLNYELCYLFDSKPLGFSVLSDISLEFLKASILHQKVEATAYKERRKITVLKSIALEAAEFVSETFLENSLGFFDSSEAELLDMDFIQASRSESEDFSSDSGRSSNSNLKDLQKRSIDNFLSLTNCSQCRVTKVNDGPWNFEISANVDARPLKKILIPVVNMEKDSSILVVQDDQCYNCYVLDKVIEGWKVEFIDYGCIEVVPLDDCYMLPNSNSSLFFTAKCKLQGIPETPSSFCVEIFSKIVDGKTLAFSTKKELSDSFIEIHLESDGFPLNKLCLQSIYEDTQLLSGSQVTVVNICQKTGLAYVKLIIHNGILAVIQAALSVAVGDLPFIEEAFPGQPCVHFSEPSSAPKRGIIVNCNETSATVNLVDYGTQVTVPVNMLRKSTPALIALAPAIVVPCVLAFTKNQKQYAKEVVQWFKGKHCLVEVLGYKSVLINDIEKHVTEVTITDTVSNSKLHDFLNESFQKRVRFASTDTTSSPTNVTGKPTEPLEILPDTVRKCKITYWRSNEDFIVNLVDSKQTQMLESILKTVPKKPVLPENILDNHCYLYDTVFGPKRICVLSQEKTTVRMRLIDGGSFIKGYKNKVLAFSLSVSLKTIPSQAVPCCFPHDNSFNSNDLMKQIQQIHFISKENSTWKVKIISTNQDDENPVGVGFDEPDFARCISPRANDVQTPKAKYTQKLSPQATPFVLSEAEGEAWRKKLKVQPPLKIGDRLTIIYSSGGTTFVHNGEDLMNQVNYLVKFLDFQDKQPCGGWTVGDLCVAQCIQDGLWYRSAIRKIGSEGIDVYFFDYGYFNVVPETRLVKISERLLEFPPLAYQCIIPFEVMKEYSYTVPYEITSLNRAENNVYEVDVKIVNLKDDLKKEIPSVPFDLDVQYDLVPVMLHKDGSLTFHLALYKDKFAEMSVLIQKLGNSMNVNLCEKVGTCCLSVYSGDNMWYRAKIIAVDGDKATVRFLDYDSEETHPRSELRELPGEWRLLPTQAITCAILHDDKVIKNPKVSAYSKLYSLSISGSFVSTSKGLALAQATVNGRSLMDLLKEEGVLSDIDLAPNAPDNLPPFKYKEGERFDAIVIHNETDKLFWIQRCDSPISKMVEDWETLVQSESTVAASNPVVGYYYLGFSELHRSWYRCQLIEATPTYYRVQYVDYGNLEDIQILHEFPKDLMENPPESVRCAFVPNFECKGLSISQIWGLKINGMLTCTDSNYTFIEWEFYPQEQDFCSAKSSMASAESVGYEIESSSQEESFHSVKTDSNEGVSCSIVEAEPDSGEIPRSESDASFSSLNNFSFITKTLAMSNDQFSQRSNISLTSIEEEPSLEDVTTEASETSTECFVQKLIDIGEENEVSSGSIDSFITREHEIVQESSSPPYDSEISKILHDLSVSAEKAVSKLGVCQPHSRKNTDPKHLLDKLETIISLASPRTGSTTMKMNQEPLQNILEVAEAQMDSLQTSGNKH